MTHSGDTLIRQWDLKFNVMGFLSRWFSHHSAVRKGRFYRFSQTWLMKALFSLAALNVAANLLLVHSSSRWVIRGGEKRSSWCQVRVPTTICPVQGLWIILLALAGWQQLHPLPVSAQVWFRHRIKHRSAASWQHKHCSYTSNTKGNTMEGKKYVHAASTWVKYKQL